MSIGFSIFGPNCYELSSLIHQALFKFTFPTYRGIRKSVWMITAQPGQTRKANSLLILNCLIIVIFGNISEISHFTQFISTNQISHDVASKNNLCTLIFVVVLSDGYDYGRSWGERNTLKTIYVQWLGLAMFLYSSDTNLVFVFCLYTVFVSRVSRLCVCVFWRICNNCKINFQGQILLLPLKLVTKRG